MAYVITQPCIGTKSGECVQVCPVDAIHPRKDENWDETTQLYIDPNTCIDCGACASVCPVSAIYQENDVPAEWKSFIEKNADYYRLDKDAFKAKWGSL